MTQPPQAPGPDGLQRPGRANVMALPWATRSRFASAACEGDERRHLSQHCPASGRRGRAAPARQLATYQAGQGGLGVSHWHRRLNTSDPALPQPPVPVAARPSHPPTSSWAGGPARLGTAAWPPTASPHPAPALRCVAQPPAAGWRRRSGGGGGGRDERRGGEGRRRPRRCGRDAGEANVANPRVRTAAQAWDSAPSLHAAQARAADPVRSLSRPSHELRERRLRAAAAAAAAGCRSDPAASCIENS